MRTFAVTPCVDLISPRRSALGVRMVPFLPNQHAFLTQHRNIMYALIPIITVTILAHRTVYLTCQPEQLYTSIENRSRLLVLLGVRDTVPIALDGDRVAQQRVVTPVWIRVCDGRPRLIGPLDRSGPVETLVVTLLHRSLAEILVGVFLVKVLDAAFAAYQP